MIILDSLILANVRYFVYVIILNYERKRDLCKASGYIYLFYYFLRIFSILIFINIY